MHHLSGETNVKPKGAIGQDGEAGFYGPAGNEHGKLQDRLRVLVSQGSFSATVLNSVRWISAQILYSQP